MVILFSTMHVFDWKVTAFRSKIGSWGHEFRPLEAKIFAHRHGLKIQKYRKMFKNAISYTFKKGSERQTLFYSRCNFLASLGQDPSDTLITSLYPKPTSHTEPKTNCSFKAIISPSKKPSPPTNTDTCDVAEPIKSGTLGAKIQSFLGLRPWWCLQATPAASLISEQLAYFKV